jgi:hypothetical protein
MATIFPVDHHATFQRWAPENSESKNKPPAWSSRRSVGFILISSLASWILVLSAFSLLI